MAMLISIHPTHPQDRLVQQVVGVLRDGGVVVYPTDSGYALGCHIGDKQAMERIRRIRQVDKHHNFTLLCRDLSEISTYAKIENADYRFLKSLTPGPYTFIYRATHGVPRRLQNPKRKTIGIRVPEHPVALALMEALGEPLMTSTLIMPGETLAMSDPDDIQDRLTNAVDVIIDSDICPDQPTTVLDMTGGYPELLRQGRGDIQWLKP